MKLSKIRTQIKNDLVEILQEGSLLKSDDVKLLRKFINEEEYHDPTPQTGLDAKGAYKPEKAKPTIQMDLINDALTEYLSALDGLVSAFTDLIGIREKLSAGFAITDVGNNGYPFGDKGIDDMFRGIIRWSAIQSEEINRRIQKP